MKTVRAISRVEVEGKVKMPNDKPFPVTDEQYEFLRANHAVVEVKELAGGPTVSSSTTLEELQAHDAELLAHRQAHGLVKAPADAENPVDPETDNLAVAAEEQEPGKPQKHSKFPFRK